MSNQRMKSTSSFSVTNLLSAAENDVSNQSSDDEKPNSISSHNHPNGTMGTNAAAVAAVAAVANANGNTNHHHRVNTTTTCHKKGAATSTTTTSTNLTNRNQTVDPDANVKVNLLDIDLWKRFRKLTNEMIVSTNLISFSMLAIIVARFRLLLLINSVFYQQILIQL